jgi:putative acetyltransferase
MQLQAGVFPFHLEDIPRAVEVWEASVRATHHFVSEPDIQLFKPLVRDALAHLPELASIRDANGQVAGFIAVAHQNIEMLFIDPSARGCEGSGTLWVPVALPIFDVALSAD